MDKRFWKGFAAYLLPTFPLGFFWHLVFFGPQYHKLEMYREDVIIPLGFSAMLLQAALFSWAYPRLFRTERSQFARSAVSAALFFGVLSWTFTTLSVAAKCRMNSVPDFIMLETAFTFLQFLVVSPLIALAHRDDAAGPGC